MQTAILTLHVVVCLILVILVLLQAGREGMGVMFGGGSNSSVFGSAGAGGVLVKLTAFLAVLFICTSLGYNLMTGTKRSGSTDFLDIQFEEPAPVPAPEVPVTNEPAVSEPLTMDDSTGSAMSELPMTETTEAPVDSVVPADSAVGE